MNKKCRSVRLYIYIYVCVCVYVRDIDALALSGLLACWPASWLVGWPACSQVSWRLISRGHRSHRVDFNSQVEHPPKFHLHFSLHLPDGHPDNRSQF